MKRAIRSLATLTFFLGGMGQLRGDFIPYTTVIATLTADNHYGLYYGRADGSDLTFVGRNEFGLWGSSGGYNWSDPETFSFTPNPGDYLFVVAWNEYGPQMWTAQVNVDGRMLYSNSTDWVYTLDPPNSSPGSTGDVPPLSSLSNVLDQAKWAAPQVSAPQGSYPWGTIPGISPAVDFVWSDTLNTSEATRDFSRYVVFRSTEPVVPEIAAAPEPSSFTLLGIGIGGVLTYCWRRATRLWKNKLQLLS